MSIKLFINRPILATVISLGIIVCGLIAAFNLPIEQYPKIAPPSIIVAASYPGASAETMEKTIAAQFENKLNGISDVIYMSSNSNPGTTTIRLTFEVGTNLSFAVNEVLNRVQATMPLLPGIVQRLGVRVERISPDKLLIINFYNDGSGNFDRYFLSNYLLRTLLNDLKLDLGVGKTDFLGNSYAVRVWLDINKMSVLRVSPDEIAAAIREQNNEYVVGRSNAAPASLSNILYLKPNYANTQVENHNLPTYNIMGGHMFSDAKSFENIIIRQESGNYLRLKDVARIELGGFNYNTIVQSTFRDKNKPDGIDQKEMFSLEVFSVPNGNQLALKKSVQKIIEKDAKNFPTGIKYYTTFDASQFVSASIGNILDTMRDAFILVGLIILLFLQSWRASIVALITIPVSIIGAFACLYLFGYSINTLTLFGLILAIGIVVDDAIVVIENIERLKIKYPNLKIKQIVELAVREVFGAVIAICLVLSVVFLPVMGLGGLSGVLYKQFAVVVACTVLISAITALTFTPAISSLLLKSHTRVNRFGLMFDRYLERVTNFYVAMAAKIIDWGKYSIITIIAAILSVIWVFYLIPLSFIPNEDMGYFLVSITLPSSSSLEQTRQISAKIATDIMQKQAIEEVTQQIGYDTQTPGGRNPNTATLTVRLKNWKYRTDKVDSADSLVKYVNKLNKKYRNVVINAFNQPPIKGLSTSVNTEFYLEGRAISDIKAFAIAANELDERLMKHKEIKRSKHILNTDVDQILIKPDVDKAKFYQVNINDIYSTIQAVYSNRNVNFAYIMQGLVWVILQADYKYRIGINNMANIYVKNLNGVMIPINSLVNISYYKAPQVVERFNGYLATKVTVEPKRGYTSGDIIKVIKLEMQNLPKGYDFEWFGSSYQQQQSQKTSILAFVFSFIMIYLVLCALYEMWRLPFVVLMGIPFALFGSGLMLLLRQQPNDLYFQISLLALLGLSAKNIILLIEFALQHFNAGHSARDSALYALKLRFRPIVMTSATFIMGAMPLIFASGAGANAEHSVGTGIVGGVLGSTFIATIFVPAYFVLIMHNFKRKSRD